MGPTKTRRFTVATPTPKSAGINQLLNSVANRMEAIVADRCINPPIGCGQPATSFKDAISQREYQISGLCQTCQAKVWEN